MRKPDVRTHFPLPYRAPASFPHFPAQRRRGFTLTELIVVVGITAVLLFLLLGPLSRTLALTARGQAQVAGQDNLRTALNRIGKEMAMAMVVHTGRPLNLWHYGAYVANLDYPEPDPAAVPVSLTVNDSCVDLVLPKHRYYCVNGGHHLMEDAGGRGDISSSLFALDTCPRHPGSQVELQPLEPLQPETTSFVVNGQTVTGPLWVRYFVGLKQPGFPVSPAADEQPPGAPSTLPKYTNGALFQATADDFDNTYVLYRCEFSPSDPQFANWRLDANGAPYQYNVNTPNAAWNLNPNFFYDATNNAGGVPYRQAWRARAVPVMSLESSDVVRFVRTPQTPAAVTQPLWKPEPLVRFVATPVEDESPQPNRPVGAVTAAGTLNAAAIAPVEYRGEFGDWTGLADDLSVPIPASLLMSNTPLAATYQFGPRIRVYGIPPTGNAQALLFDTQDSSVRQRLVTFDSDRGVIGFAIPRSHEPNSAAPNAADPTAYNAQLTINATAPYTINLAQDVGPDRSVAVANGRLMYVPQGTNGAVQVPTTFGTARQTFGAMARIVPGSEVIQRVVIDNSPNGSGQPVGYPMRRAGWEGISDELDRVVSQDALNQDEYTIDYGTGVITFTDQDPGLLFYGRNQQRQIWVRYQFQTNDSRDVLRATYATRELITINMGVVQYAARSSEALPVEATQQVRVRNMTR